MLIQVTPVNYRKSKAGIRLKKPAPAALTLVSAVYTWPNLWARLTFDRPIDFSGINVAAITISNTGDNDTLYGGTGTATAVSPVTVQVPLAILGPATGTGLVLLSATAANGIVAADDGGAWPGVTDWEIDD